jgi:hypothetical protein
MAAVCLSETLVSTYEIIHSVTTKKNNIVIFKYVLTASFDIVPIGPVIIAPKLRVHLSQAQPADT